VSSALQNPDSATFGPDESGWGLDPDPDLAASIIHTAVIPRYRTLLCGSDHVAHRRVGSAQAVEQACGEDLPAISERRGNALASGGVTLRLADVVWHYTFMHYFWLKEQRDKGKQPV
jgi:hypothetical protein